LENKTIKKAYVNVVLLLFGSTYGNSLAELKISMNIHLN